MTGYTRNDTADNIADGKVINASDLDGEFNAVQAAFHATTGHTHNGTTGGGAQIDYGDLANLPDLTNAAITGGTINGTTIGGTTAAAGAFTTLSASGAVTLSGNTTLGDASTDTVTVNGTAAIGGTPGADIALRIDSSSLTSTGVRAVRVGYSIPATSTTNAISFFSIPALADSATTGTVYHFRADNATLGTGSSVTDQHGIYVNNLTSGTNNYGITSAVSIGTNKWNIYASGTAANYFAGNVGIGTSSPSSELHIKDSAANATLVLEANSAGTSNVFFGDFASAGVGRVSYDHAVDQMYFYTGSSERMRLTSTGLGIGTSSPAYKLSVDSGSTDASAFFNSTSANGSHIRFAASGTVKNYIGNAAGFITSGSADDLGLRATGKISFATNGAAADMTLDSSGNLGLGVTPSAWTLSGVLQYGKASLYSAADSQVSMQANTYYDGAFKYIANNYASQYQQTSGQHRWYTAPSGTAGNAISFTQAMTLDASGRLIVGYSGTPWPQSVSNSSITAAMLQSTGAISSTVDQTTALYLNRTTSDGDIAAFYKNGTKVGSIGNNGDNLGIESVDVGLLFLSGNAQIVPTGGNYGVSDGTKDLGRSTTRFKDLYLSGGVYVGGTAAANHLDDYEEGTWTPVIADATTGGNTGTFTNNGCFYTKVGNVVHLHINISAINTSGMTAGNVLYIRGLPYTTNNGTNRFIGAAQTGSVTKTETPVINTAGNATYMRLFAGTSDLLVSAYISGAALVYADIRYQTA